MCTAARSHIQPQAVPQLPDTTFSSHGQDPNHQNSSLSLWCSWTCLRTRISLFHPLGVGWSYMEKWYERTACHPVRPTGSSFPFLPCFMFLCSNSELEVQEPKRNRCKPLCSETAIF